jgi:hypothetical protein
MPQSRRISLGWRGMPLFIYLFNLGLVGLSGEAGQREEEEEKRVWSDDPK